MIGRGIAHSGNSLVKIPEKLKFIDVGGNMFEDLPKNIRDAYDLAVEELRKYDVNESLKPNTLQWEAAVKLAIATLPIEAHAEGFRDYLNATLPKKPSKCQRNDDAIICKAGPIKFNTRCDLCGKIHNKL